MENRDLAFQDWKAGMKYQDIAEKYEISINTLKSWIQRDFKNRKGAKRKGKRGAPKKPKKIGAPFGNKNAIGNHGGAPEGNKNGIKHGAYEKFLAEYMGDDEKEVFQAAYNDDVLEHYRKELALLCAQEVRIQRRIMDLKNVPSGLVIERAESSQSTSYTGIVQEQESGKASVKGVDGTVGYREANTRTSTVSVADGIYKLEDQLIRVQRQKTKLLDLIEKTNIMREHLMLERAKLGLDKKNEEGVVINFDIPKNS